MFPSEAQARTTGACAPRGAADGIGRSAMEAIISAARALVIRRGRDISISSNELVDYRYGNCPISSINNIAFRYEGWSRRGVVDRSRDSSYMAPLPDSFERAGPTRGPVRWMEHPARSVRYANAATTVLSGVSRRAAFRASREHSPPARFIRRRHGAGSSEEASPSWPLTSPK